MATHDYVIDNSTGANVRADLNLVLQAILSNNSSSSAPSTTAAYMLWVDTTANIVKIRNSANNAWINLFTTTGGVDVDAPSNFNEDVTFTGATSGRNIVFDKSADQISVLDNAKISFGNNNDLSIYHTATHSIIEDSGTGNLKVLTSQFNINNAANNEAIANFIENGAVELYYDSSKKFETASYGVSTDGVFNINGTGDKILLADNGKIAFGGGTDLQIYSSGSIGHIKAANDDLRLETSRLTVLNRAGNETLIDAYQDGAVELYHDNSKKFQTYGNGNEFFGNLKNETDGTANGIYLGAANDLQLYHDSNTFFRNNNNAVNLILQSDYMTFKGNSTNEDYIKCVKDAQVEQYYNNAIRTQTVSDGFRVRGKQYISREDGGIGDHANFRQAFFIGVANGGSGTATVQVANVHAGGTVTIMASRGLSSPNATVATTKSFPIEINAGATATLGSELYSVNGNNGSFSFSVAAAASGITISNPSATFNMNCFVTFDLTGFV